MVEGMGSTRVRMPQSKLREESLKEIVESLGIIATALSDKLPSSAWKLCSVEIDFLVVSGLFGSSSEMMYFPSPLCLSPSSNCSFPGVSHMVLVVY